MSSRLLFRMAAPTVGVSLLLLAMGVGAAWYIQRLQSETSDLLSRQVASLHATRRLTFNIREVRSLLNRFLITGDRDYLLDVSEKDREIEHYLHEAQELALTPSGRTTLENVRKNYNNFRREFADLVEQPTTVASREAIRHLSEGVVTADLLELAQDYLEYKQAAVNQAMRDNQAVGSWMVFGLLLLGASGAVAGLLSGFVLARGLSRSIVQMSVPIQSAAGKLDEVIGPVTVATGGSIEELQEGLDDMVRHIGDVVEKLQQSRQQALRSEQLAAVGQLAAGMAHELRNPLTSMKILVQSAAERSDGTGLRNRDLDVLQQEISRLEELIRTFLDFARPCKVSAQEVDIAAIVDDTVRFLRPRAKRRLVSIENVGPSSALRVVADAHQIRQVLLNLILNALEALPGGGTVWVRVAPDGDDWLTIEVADNGSGLPDDMAERIFEPFVSTKETGLGLGLSICRRIAEAHGGTIEAAAREGGGAVFMVRLPVVPELDEVAEPSLSTAPSQAG